MARKVKLRWIVLGLLVLVFLSSSILVNFYVNILWFREVDYLSTFLKIFGTNWGLRGIQIAVFFLFFFFNFLILKKVIYKKFMQQASSNVINIGGQEADLSFMENLSRKTINLFIGGFSLFLAVVFSVVNPEAWRHFLFYLNGTEFGITDPILGRDAGFYVFELPFLRFVFESGLIMLVVTLVIVIAGYFLLARPSIRSYRIPPLAQKHLLFLVSILMFWRAWGYRLDIYRLMFSREGVVFGPGYVDATARIPVFNILSIALIIIGIVTILSIFLRSKKHVLFLIVGWLVVAFALTTVYPNAIQRFRVEPNELAREGEYIGNNIEFTNIGFNLHNIEEREFSFTGDLNWDVIEENYKTIENLRIWDWRPIMQTYRQLEERRPYYVFNRIDIDRYQIDGEQRQVMLAPREMDQRLLPDRAKTWVNESLRYTHGFGMAMSPVNTATPEGFPDLIIRDIPPVYPEDIPLENPSIYFGEMENEFVVVNNASGEFHYPAGDENIQYDYSGEGGIPIQNSLRRLIFAIRFNSFQILLAGDINPESRLMFDRSIHQRVRKIAPFLAYDGDPYTVIHDGGIVWVQDAYTVTDMFPYSEPSREGVNYIRNSVKIVIDAYQGSVDFYVVDQDDPIIQTYQKIFPDMFKSIEDFPEGLEKHFRYPEDLFSIQARMLTTYHMREPREFYNREDQWDLPQERYGGSTINMTPYYTLMELPGEEGLHFILMTPFTPVGRNNMIAWLSAKCDPENYGELVQYNFPKDRLVFGPMQIEAQIDQNDEISQILSLWDQHGSRVIRGNLLVLPIGDTVLYVEPVFLQSEQAEIPQLRRIIMATGERVVMEPNIEMAMASLLGERIPEELEGLIEEDILPGEELPEEEDITVEDELPVYPETEPGTLDELIVKAQQAYQKAQEALKEGDWANYGVQQEILKDILEEMAEKLEEAGWDEQF